MNFMLSITPEEEKAALGLGSPLIHLAYGLESRGQDYLTVRGLSASCRGGFLGLDDNVLPGRGDPSGLASQILQECERRAYRGVLADFKGPVCDSSLALLERIENILFSHKLTMMVPERWGALLGRTQVLICSALSGGQLREHLEEGLDSYGSRAVLELRRLSAVFTIPCPTGEGTPISQAELQGLLGASPACYSEALGCNYLAFHTNTEGQTRLVLYDTAETLFKKQALAERLGYSRAVVRYSETQDLPSWQVRSLSKRPGNAELFCSPSIVNQEASGQEKYPIP